jgi:hypothetical protein
MLESSAVDQQVWHQMPAALVKLELCPSSVPEQN